MAKGSRGRSGRGRGGANRGRGNRGGRHGGGGRRQLRPSPIGYVYEPETYSDSDLLDDFRLYGQFDDSSDESEEDLKRSKNKKSKKKKNKKGGQQQKTEKGLKIYLGDEPEDDVVPEHRPGLGSSSSNARRRPAAAKGGYPAAVNFVQSVTQTLDDSSDQEEDIKMASVESAEKIDLGEGTVPFYFDSNPSEPNMQAEKPTVNKKQKKSKKTKLVRGDDLYLSEDSQLEEEMDDESMEILRDYMENTSLDEMDLLQHLTSQLDRLEDDSIYDYGLLEDEYSEEDDLDHEERLLEYESDDDEDSYDEFYSSAKDLEEVSPTAFASENTRTQGISSKKFAKDSSDAFERNTPNWREIEISPFQRSLEDALAQVPPGLQAGLRGKLAFERKMEKQRHRMQLKEKKRSKEGKERKGNDHLDLRKIDSRIRDFIKDDSISSYHFQPMSKHTRRQIHLLARAYNLDSSSIGHGAHRTPTLTKTDRTFMPTDRRYIDRFIEEAQMTIDLKYKMASRKALRPEPLPKGKKFNLPKHSGPKKGGPKSNKGAVDTGPAHGTVVGSGVAPIGESNVGHRMLAALGWKQGDALGANNDGIRVPIEAVIRKKRRGLGS
ncbi:hypothetical protein EC973_006036 [Apophysomyces ossiformis]|uniref:Protein SQS1 n=1 Tax=Apophysomyces ossiformis TaxID=679940 RepID=A0A8H7ERA0_9FUNG|nr:hypothetical protein EC973_006036 [Apophysomyces ossiformis]